MIDCNNRLIKYKLFIAGDYCSFKRDKTKYIKFP